MRLMVNGQPASFEGAPTVADLVRRLELSPQRVAVEVNERLVRRVAYAETPLKDGDRVEIVTLVGGG